MKPDTLTPLQKAFKEWASYDSSSCHCSGHWKVVRDDNGNPESKIMRADSDVCERERKWRAYVALRDVNLPPRAPLKQET